MNSSADRNKAFEIIGNNEMMFWIFLPAFNEAESLKQLIPKIDDTLNKMQCKYRIVIVNDGSIDRTFEIINNFSKELPIDAINHAINRGLGETERDGFEFIVSKCADDDIIIRLDCDDTHEPEYIPTLIGKLNEGYDVVSASRFQKGGGQLGVHWYRAFVSYSANVFMKFVFNIKGIKDYSCGYRVYRGSAIRYAIKIFGNRFIQLKGLGFTSTLETVVKLNLMGCRFSEIPFTLRYNQKKSPSKMVTSVTTLGYIAMALLYHWPFGGWNSFFYGLSKVFKKSPELAVEQYGCYSKKSSMIMRIGGG